MRHLYCLCVIVSCFVASIARAETLTIAVASNFAKPIKEISKLFEEKTGHKVKVAFGSSGKFYAQIQNGAPFHAFFSADQQKPKALEKSGLAVANSRFTYATGRLVLWSASDKLVDGEAMVLRQSRYKKLAIANPRLAPYGLAAKEVLSSLDLTGQTKAKLIYGENISQTFQFVSTGNADIGFVSYSQIINKGSVKNGSVWIVPETLHQPIRQDAVLLKTAKNNKAAEDFFTFVRSKAVVSIIESYGYSTQQNP